MPTTSDRAIARQARRRLTGLSAAQVCRYLGLPIPPDTATTHHAIDAPESMETKESDEDQDRESPREDDYLDSIESTSQIDHNSCSASCCPWESEPDMGSEEDSAVGLPSPAETTFMIPDTHTSKHTQPSQSDQQQRDDFNFHRPPSADNEAAPAFSSAPDALVSETGAPTSPLSLESPLAIEQALVWEALPPLPSSEETAERETDAFGHLPVVFPPIHTHHVASAPIFSSSYFTSVDYTGMPPLSPSSTMAPASMPPVPPYPFSSPYHLDLYRRDLQAYSENGMRVTNVYAYHNNYGQGQYDETQARAAMQLMRLLEQWQWHGAWRRQ